MADEFSNVEEVSSPARECYLIAPHASNPLPSIPKAIRCDVAGTIAFRAIDSAADVSMTLVAGERLDIRIGWVRAAGTTATLHALA